MSRKKIHRRPTNNTKKPESVGRQYPESNPNSATNENCKNSELTEGMMTTGEHLEELRKTFIGILTIVFLFSCIAFVCKDRLFDIIFAPSSSEFILYRLINSIVDSIGVSWMHLDTFNVQLISTELSAQFMTHIEMSLYFGLLAASPYIVYRIFGYIRPALYENERRYSTYLVMAVYVLFAIGVLMNYYIIFPISFRFLGTYQVNKAVISTIAISSYVSSFVLLSFMMGVVFEIPILAFILGKLGLINASMLCKYRKPAFVIIMIVSAFITPPDIFTLILMTIPLYLLYETGILVLKRMK